MPQDTQRRDGSQSMHLCTLLSARPAWLTLYYRVQLGEGLRGSVSPRDTAGEQQNQNSTQSLPGYYRGGFLGQAPIHPSREQTDPHLAPLRLSHSAPLCPAPKPREGR